MSRRDLIDQRIDDVPIAILDFETTGFSPKAGARVVEVAAVRVEPGQDPCLVLDTLVDPEGPVHCTSIHGIDDDDVVGAPRFGQATHLVVQALSDAMVGSFNASFDMAFLEAEARNAHRAAALERPPHVCLMWLRPLLKIGRRCSLEQACSHFGLPSGTHRAADDAMVSAHLWRCYIAAAKKLGVTRLRDLRNLGTHRYLESFDVPPYSRELAARYRPEPPGPGPKPRSTSIRWAMSPLVSELATLPASEFATLPTSGLARRNIHERRRAYWRGLIDALADEQLSLEELAGLRALQRELGLSPDEIRAIHGRLLGNVLQVMAEDHRLETDEVEDVSFLMESLAALGWAPGMPSH